MSALGRPGFAGHDSRCPISPDGRAAGPAHALRKPRRTSGRKFVGHRRHDHAASSGARSGCSSCPRAMPPARCTSRCGASGALRMRISPRSMRMERCWPGIPCPGGAEHIPVATGSLGHGFPVALGMALARQIQNEPGRIFCLTSDGEWQEGSMWEGLIFWAHRQLRKITVLVDLNGLQGFGADPRSGRSRVCGHESQVRRADVRGRRPRSRAIAAAASAHPGAVILLDTVKGKGVSFMENRMEWHYLPLSAEQYRRGAGRGREPP